MLSPPGLNWSYVGLMAAVSLVAFLVAFPLWRRQQPIFGNLAGTVVIFVAAVALIFTEHVQLDRITSACLDAGYVCWPEPSAFTRFAIYASIAFVEIMALFYASILYEERLRNRDYAPEWRRW
jgi:hypothetical protein